MIKRQKRRPFVLIVAAAAALASLAAAAAGRMEKWWRDFGGGPAGSRFVDLDQIDKSNVGRLEVAWFYPYATIGFNPIVVEDVMYAAGRNGSLIALDATTGREIWIHEGLTGMNARGINYWQSPDGKDRRLLFSINYRERRPFSAGHIRKAGPVRSEHDWSHSLVSGPQNAVKYRMLLTGALDGI